MIRNRLLRPVATLGAATLAAVLGTAGLAVAGVDLPDPATKAFEQAGISLPNQAGGGQSGEHARSDEVHSVLNETPPSERDCAFGHRVAEAARGSLLPEHARSACEEGNSAAHRKDGDHSSRSDHSQFGQDTADKARGLGDATPSERRSFGKDTSEGAGQLGGAPDGTPSADKRPESPPAGGTTGAPEGTPDGPPDVAPVPEDTPAGPPDGTPGGHP